MPISAIDFNGRTVYDVAHHINAPAGAPANRLSAHAGLEEQGPVTAERITPEQFARMFPGTRLPEGARGAYLVPREAGSRVRIYSAHDTLWDQLRKWLEGERAKLPEGVEVDLLRLPADASELKAPGVIVEDWMLKLPYGQQVLPELKAEVGKPLPAIHSA